MRTTVSYDAVGASAGQARRGARRWSGEEALSWATMERVSVNGVELEFDSAGSGEAVVFEPWLDVVVDGFAHPDTQGVPSHEEFPREVVARAMRDLTAVAGVMRYVALRDGVLAGGASFRVAEGVAQLTGEATAPRTAAGVCRPRCCRPGSPMPPLPAAASP